MHTLHASVAASREWLATSTSPASGASGVHRSAAAFGTVLWAVVAALLAVSTAAFAGPVDASAGSGASRSDARWVTRLGRPDHRPLSLMATDAEFEAESKSGRSRDGAFVATDSDRWWAHVGVPEGVTVASLTSQGDATTTLDRFLCGNNDKAAAQRFFIGDGMDGMHQLRRAEAAVMGKVAIRAAYSTYAAATTLTSAADRFLGLATPVFGAKFRLAQPVVTGWEPLGGGRSSGTVRTGGSRSSFTTGGAVPVGTDDEAGKGSSDARPRTAASSPATSSSATPPSGMLATILANGGGLMVWQLSRRRKTAVRATTRPVTS